VTQSSLILVALACEKGGDPVSLCRLLFAIPFIRHENSDQVNVRDRHMDAQLRHSPIAKTTSFKEATGKVKRIEIAQAA